MDKVAIVTGVGPGLGAALCRKLGGEGYAVAALARSTQTSEPLAQEMAGAGQRLEAFACDVTDPAAVNKTVTEITERLGPVSVLIHNAARMVRKPFGDIAPEEFESAWRVSAYGAMVTASAVLPGMLATGGGTILFTGATAALRGGANFAAFASASFAKRGLAQSIAREHGKNGIHVAHVVIDGIIWSQRAKEQFGMTEDACLDPDVIAENYIQLINQDRTAWSHEIDLRPAVETF